jgi:hypothetical protein
MLILSGIFSIVDGLVAIVHDEAYLVGEEFIVGLDYTTWGVIHFLVGVGLVAAGIAIANGQVWGRAVGVAVAMISAFSQIWFITAYPLWTILIIAVDIIVIYALIVQTDERETI